MTPSVHVLGSLNIDSVARVQELPLPGQTVHALSSSRDAGGKGANQAVAAARAGSQTYMSGVVGLDDEGEILVKRLKCEGIETSFVRKDERTSTGRANVTVQENGENSIVIVAGANNSLSDEDAERSAQIVKRNDILLLQLETPINASKVAAKLAHERGATVVLNAAPARSLPRELMNYIDVIIVNENELKTIGSDHDDIQGNARRIAVRDEATVVVTLGKQGALYTTKHFATETVAAPPVTAVDTTGAGDAFVGYFASALSCGYELERAISIAVVAGSMTVQKSGAQHSIPNQNEVLKFSSDLQTIDTSRK